MSYLRLKFCNWNVITTDLLETGLQLKGARLLPMGILAAGMVARGSFGSCANPHLSRFGAVDLVSGCFEQLCRVKQGQLQVEDVRSFLRTVPAADTLFALSEQGADWTLAAREDSARALRPEDVLLHGWRLIFEVGGNFQLFPFSGEEFAPLLGLFPLLNGDRTEPEVEQAAGAHAPLARRLLAWLEQFGLLERAARPASDGAEFRGVELVSHSSLYVADGKGSLIIDPAFVHDGREAAHYRGMEWHLAHLPRVSAVFISHHHWDHLHLPSLVRIPRSTPIYIPAHGVEHVFNPSIRRFLETLGFQHVHELRTGDAVRVGEDISLTALPFHGEWFGPGSAFDAYTYLVELSGRRIYGTVDSDQDERGAMVPVLRELRERQGPIDLMFFCSSAQRHASPLICGRPFRFSNTYGAKYAERMRYHPDWSTVASWCEILRPAHITPYAEFIFASQRTDDAPPLRLEAASVEPSFEDYWREVERTPQPRLAGWKKDLEGLRAHTSALGVQFLMLNSGQRVALDAPRAARS